MNPDKNLAKMIVLEILKQAKEGRLGKTKLYKAFWLSHLFFNDKSITVLSDWPIVRMPNGPGIDRGDVLLSELVDEKKIKIRHEKNGPFTEIVCELRGDVESDLSSEALSSISEAVKFVQDSTAADLSRISHIISRSWNKSDDGDELNIYIDPMDDDEYEATRREMRRLRDILREKL